MSFDLNIRLPIVKCVIERTLHHSKTTVVEILAKSDKTFLKDAQNKVGEKKTGHVQNLAINKKSTIFVQSS